MSPPQWGWLKQKKGRPQAPLLSWRRMSPDEIICRGRRSVKWYARCRQGHRRFGMTGGYCVRSGAQRDRKGRAMTAIHRRPYCVVHGGLGLNCQNDLRFMCEPTQNGANSCSCASLLKRDLTFHGRSSIVRLARGSGWPIHLFHCMFPSKLPAGVLYGKFPSKTTFWGD